MGSLVSTNWGKSFDLSSALVSAINKMKANILNFKKLFSGLKCKNHCELLGTIAVNISVLCGLCRSSHETCFQ